MNKIFTTDEIKLRAIPIAQKFGIKKLSLFGSYARKDANSQSDLDFLIEKGKLRGLWEYADFIEELEKEFQVHVDVLVDEATEDKFFTKIKREEVVLYEQ